MNRLVKPVALGIALRDASLKIGEDGGNNEGERIREYLINVDPPINFAAPWCAAAVQFWTDLAARKLRTTNPLDVVRREAYVQDYYDALDYLVVEPQDTEPGDLVLFSFGGERWDHIGLVVAPPAVGTPLFTSVEGNTSDENERDGDVVAEKTRRLDASYRTAFIAWDREAPE